MSDKYQSILRTFVTRNMYEDILTPGTDVVVPPTSAAAQFISYFPSYANKETNFLIRKAGVFSNFADGLVFKTPANRLNVNFNTYAYNRDGASFTLDMTYGLKAVTVTAGTTGWVGGTTYPVEITATGAFGTNIVNIVAIDATSGTLIDYWHDVTSLRTAYNLDLVFANNPYRALNISALNCMYEVNHFAEPFEFANGLDYQLAAILVEMNNGPGHDTEFLTHSIASAFARESVFFDVVTEIEFTLKP